MQFNVPQNLDIEDRIFGNYSLKQIVYVVGSLGAAFFLWRSLPIYLSLPLSGGIVGFALALAFYPEQKLGKPFSKIVEAGFRYYIKEKLYTWKKIPKKVTSKQQKEALHTNSLTMANISESNLRNLSWNVDIKKENE